MQAMVTPHQPPLQHTPTHPGMRQTHTYSVASPLPLLEPVLVFSASAGAAAFSATFGGATAGSASATAEDRGKRRATDGHSSSGRSIAGKSRVKAKATTTAGPTATAATARADRPTTPFTFSGADFVASKWLQLVLQLVATHFADCACVVRQCSFI